MVRPQLADWLTGFEVISVECSSDVIGVSQFTEQEEEEEDEEFNEAADWG